MYVPANYQLKDPELIKKLIRENSFGLLISGTQATHLPFCITANTDNLLLSGHIARKNPHLQSLSGEVLIVFQGPHAYMSPTLYERFHSVPTWNYLAVHCYGEVELLGEEENTDIVEHLIRQEEPAYLQHWNQLPDSYRQGLNKGITSFRIRVSRIEAAAKLGQDRTANELHNIYKALRASVNTTDQSLADWMEIILPAIPLS